MSRPEIKEIISGTKKEGHSRIRFVCPTCTKIHEMRTCIFDKIEDGKYPCPNNKKAAFKSFIDKQIRDISADKMKAIRQMLSEGKAFSTIVRRLDLRHIAILHALVSTEYLHYSPKVTMPKTDVQTASPVSPVTNNYHAPVTIINEAPRPVQPSVPAQPHKIPTIDYMPPVPAVYNKPMPGTIAFDKLSFAERINIQGELARLQKESN